jgi:subtilisin family serine protease
MKWRFHLLCSVILVVLSLSLVAGGDSAEPLPIVPASLIQKALAQGQIPVIVRLSIAWTPELSLPSAAHVANQRQAIQTLAGAVKAALRGFNHRVKREYDGLPFLALVVDAQALQALNTLPGIVSEMVEDELSRPQLAESVPIAYQSGPAWPGELDGTGTVVAVLDTGVDKTHAFLSGKVIAEACFSTTGSGATSLCPGGVDSTAPGSGVNCTGAEDCEHGTHVAGIVAGGSTGVSGAGVAPGSKLWAIQVFSRIDDPVLCGGFNPCVGSFTSDQIAALNYVFRNRVMAALGGRAVAAVNMSLGAGAFLSSCDGNTRKPAIDNLRAAGTATVIASGNDGSINAISSPACISTSIAVGSTDDGSLSTTQDVVSFFSNIGPFANLLLAPGQWILSSVPGGFVNLRGTSMAAPHVAGAFAVLRQHAPDVSVTTLFEALRDTGLPIVDTRSGGLETKPRIRIGEALAMLGEVRFGTATFSVAEVDGTATITVVRTGSTAGQATVNYATSNGTAIAGTHYTATSGTLTLNPGESSKTFTVGLVDNTVVNADRTVKLKLTSPTGAMLGNPFTAVLTIVNDDNGGAIAFADPSFSGDENAGVATITVVRSGTNLASGVTVPFKTANGSAVAPADYTATAGTLTFGAGETSKTFTVPIINDTLLEGNKTFQVLLGTPGGGGVLGSPSTATVTIVEDDTAGTVQFSAPTFTVNEGAASAIITVTRTGTNLAGGVRVRYAATSGTATAGSDFGAVSNTLTFGAGVTSMTFAVPIINDPTMESPETVNLALTVPAGSAATLGSPSTALLTIQDNDAPVIQFAVAAQSVTEGATASVVVTRANNLSLAVSADYQVTGGTATGGGVDYTLASGTVTFGAGVTSATIKIPTINDTLAEGPETIVLGLQNPTGAATLGARTQTTITITDNDSGGVIQFGRVAYSVAENISSGGFNLTVTRTGTNLASNVSVDYAVTGGSATNGVDYTLANGTLTFIAGQTSLPIPVTILDDLLPDGNKTVVVTLSNPSAHAALGTIKTTTLTILDAEQAIGFSSPSYSVTEGSASIAIPILRAGPTPGGVTITCQTVAGGTAIPDVDHKSVNTTLTFAAGSRLVNCIVPILNDTLVDGSRTVNVALSGDPALLIPSRSTAILTINDNDQGGVLRFSAATASVTEGGTATVTVTRTGVNLASDVTVDYLVTGGSATGDGVDYTLANGTLPFGAGVTSRTFTVPTVSDTLAEGPETITIALANPTGGASLGAPATTTLTIVDNDSGGVIAFALAIYTVTEGNSATLTVKRIGANLASNVTVDYAVTRGTATNSSDFSLPNGTLTFEDGETTKTIVVAIPEDGIAEGSETFVVTLGNPGGGATLGSPASTTITIRDAAQVRFLNSLVFCNPSCQNFTARLTTGQGHIWESVSGVASPYQAVPEPQLTNRVVEAVEFGISVSFPGSFTITPASPELIVLSVDSTGTPVLLLFDEGKPATSAEAALDGSLGTPSAPLPPGARFQQLRAP